MLHPDFRDLLAALAAEQVEYLVVGGYAVGFHTRPRFTKDIDLWVRDSETNLARLLLALERFGAPETILAALRTGSSEDIVWFGVAPTRVDILRRIEGGSFDLAYERRVDTEWEGAPVSIISLGDLIDVKRAAGREQDLRDVRALERTRGKK
jgi:hypothetical protein